MPAEDISPLLNGGSHKHFPPHGLGPNMPSYIYNGEVAISGISGRFPESANMEEFQDHLMKNEDMVTEDNRRWDVGLHGLPPRNGKLKELGHFDAVFFGVHPKQADNMDPQLKMLLESSYEAIVDAGQTIDSVRGTRTGVFVGVSNSECEAAWSCDPEKVVGYSMPGCARNMFANRISFFFDFRGPSFSLDTACSSSAVCLDQALQHIRMGNIDAAIVGGSNLVLKAMQSLQFHRMGMLSPDGACKSFDASGDGYCRSEAITVIYLQKVKNCKRIYATVVHSKSNSDGYKEQGITFPSGLQQANLIKEVYHETGVDPLDVSYVEAHGTGTKVGDPQELNALAGVFCKGRQSPLLIGSVKSNMGHSECCSGLNAIAKLVVAMETRLIPANLHFQKPNPEIPGLEDGSFKVVAENTRWKGGLAAVNSFGFGGSNVHCLLKSNQKEFETAHPASQKPRLFTYCGHTEEGVQAVLSEAEKHSHSVEFQSLIQPSANMPFNQLPYRGYTVLNASAKMDGIQKSCVSRRPVWFVFSGMGTQWQGMGRKMMALDAFQQSIRKSSKYLARYDIDLYDLIMNGDDTTFDQTIPSFIGICGIQIALVDVLTSMGIKPDGIVGHSVGELGCAYADGSLTAQEAVMAAYWRGRCITEATLPPGKMAAVGLSWEECKKLCPEGVVPACHNSIDTVTISGPAEATTKFVEDLKAQGIFAREVKSSNVAFHSYYMKGIAPQLKDALEKFIVPKKRSSKWVSTSVPECRWQEELAQYSSAEYHVNNLVSPVLFQEGLQKVPSNAVALEIAPHSLLQAILKRSLSMDAIILGCMKRFHEDNVEFFFEAIGKCYANGVDVNPLSVYPPVEYPVPRGTPMISSCVSKIWDHGTSWKFPKHEDFPISGQGASTDSVFDVDVSDESPDHYLVGHKIDGRVLFPATGYLVLAWKALARLKGQLYQETPVVFQNVHIQRATVLPPAGPVTLSVSIMPSTGEFEISENGSLSVSGVVSSPEGDEFLDRHRYPVIGEAMGKRFESRDFELTREEVYKELRLRGYEYGPTFQGVLRSNLTGDSAEVKWDGRWIPFMDTLLQAQILTSHEPLLRLPVRLKSVKIDPRCHPPPPGEDEEAMALMVVSDRILDMSVCGGVEIQGVELAIAPRRPVANSPTLEEYRFVPYADLPDTPVEPSLADYCTQCLHFTLDSLKNLLAKDTDNVVPNKDLLQRVTENNKLSCQPDISKRSKFSTSISGFSQALERIFSLPLSNDFHENVRNVLSSFQPHLATDMLLSHLDQPATLKPALDIVLENLPSKKISLFEVGACSGCLYNKMVPLLESQPLVKVHYTAADKSPANKDCKNLGVKTVQWDVSTASSPPPGQSDLVVLKNVLHKQQDIDKAFQLISSIVSSSGFILVEEVTYNFPLHLVLEALTETLDLSLGEKEDRICGFYLSEERWCNVFAQHGFEVVYTKSNSLLSTLFLLRRKFEVKQIPSQLSIDNLDCAWVEDLKAKMKSLESAPEEERLWLVARNGTNGIVGLVNCLRHEAGGDKVRFIFISNLNSSSRVPKLDMGGEEFRSLMEKDLVMNVYRDGHWGSFRHIPISQDLTLREKPCPHAYVNVLTRGDLTSLKWIESPLKYFHQDRHHDDGDNTRKEKELCSVYYTSLNFRDIMLASGKLPPDALQPDVATQECILGMEFAGRNASGQRVMGLLACKGLATSVDTDGRFTWAIPDHWTMEQAATVPVVYSTVYYALVVRGQIRRGDRVLIHSGSGGVGQAAIAVALSYDCEVFTTVGSQEKKEFLKKAFPQLKDRNFSSSRDLTFEYDVLKETNGKGVDIVLNSLAEEKLQSSVQLLAKNGRFLEIGKFDLSKNSSLGMSIFLRNISFHGVLLDSLFGEHGCQDWLEVAQKVQEGIDRGVVRPLKATVFDKEEVEQAFRFMAQGKHIGKVVIKVREEEPDKVAPPSPLTIPAIARTACNPCKSYVIVGGLGGFGLELAQWLVQRGATKIVLTSRSGVKTGYQRLKLEHWNTQGVKVKVSHYSCVTENGAKALLEEAANLAPIGGIFNLAMVLRDGLLENQTVDTFTEVTDPKVKGTVNLDKLTRDFDSACLDWFVVFSSVSCGRGNLGQANYGWANSAMERICEKRRADNLHGLAIQWGAIGDVGVIAESMGGNDVVVGGSIPQRMRSCLEVLDHFVHLPHAVVSSFVQAHTERNKEGGGAKKHNLVQAVSKILGVKDSSQIDGEVSLAELGLDSLMGVEIKQLLERDHDLVLSTKEIRLLNLNRLHAINDADGEDDDDADDDKGSQTAGEKSTSDGSPLTAMALQRFDCQNVLPKETMVLLNGVKNGLKPLFVVHPVEGNIETLRALACHLPCPVYGIQLTTDAPLTSLQALAGFYLQAIHQVDPSGPYRLAGYSLGSVIAMEMACQLRKHQTADLDPVQSLTLLDGSHSYLDMYTNAYRKALRPKSLAEEQAGIMVGFLKQFIPLEDELEIYQQLFQHRDLSKQVELTVDILMKTEAFPSRDDLENLATAFYHLLRIANSHQAGQYPGDITLVRAKHNTIASAMISAGALRADYNLQEVCDGHVTVMEVDGDHETFLLDNGAERVAKIMMDLLP